MVSEVARPSAARKKHTESSIVKSSPLAFHLSRAILDPDRFIICGFREIQKDSDRFIGQRTTFQLKETCHDLRGTKPRMHGVADPNLGVPSVMPPCH